MSFSIIAAIGKNNELGKDNNLIWKLPNDLKFFKEVTTGHTIIMGRRTFESLPKMLPNRHHIVISSSNDFPSEVEVFNSIDSLLEKYKDVGDELFIIGGGSIYKLFIDYADKLYLTEVESEDNSATVYFPNFNKKLYDKEIIKENNDGDIKYTHVIYKKK